MIFNKGKNKNTNILFIDASQHFEAGKDQNKLREEDINKIVGTYRRFNSEQLKPGVIEKKYSYVATHDEIKENEFNLNIARYVDTFEEEAEIDLKSVQKKIDHLEKELSNVQREMKIHLTKLGI